MSARLAFITGASSGIGQALAARYAQAGWRLALVARGSEGIAAWADAQGLGSDRVVAYAADVRDVDRITAVGRECIERLGLPDVVIASAGISVGVDSADFADLAQLRATFETNNIGMAATFQPFVLPMRERRSGTLVGIASVAGIRGLPGHGGYCASKAGVISYCESLRGECRPHGVQVVTIAPGYIDTPLTQRNRYRMPFLMAPDAFADRAFAHIGAGVRKRFIPWQMGVVAGLLRLLPDGLYDRVLAGRPRKRRLNE